MRKEPSRKDLLDEVGRLRAQNARLARLAASNRPELKQLRDVEVKLREFVMWYSQTLKEIYGLVYSMLPPGQDDLPSLEEMGGMLSTGAHRVDAAFAALDEAQAIDAVDPVGGGDTK